MRRAIHFQFTKELYASRNASLAANLRRGEIVLGVITIVSVVAFVAFAMRGWGIPALAVFMVYFFCGYLLWMRFALTRKYRRKAERLLPQEFQVMFSDDGFVVGPDNDGEFIPWDSVSEVETSRYYVLMAFSDGGQTRELVIPPETIDRELEDFIDKNVRQHSHTAVIVDRRDESEIVDKT